MTLRLESSRLPCCAMSYLTSLLDPPTLMSLACRVQLMSVTSVYRCRGAQMQKPSYRFALYTLFLH
jgi:hypothetical protein